MRHTGIHRFAPLAAAAALLLSTAAVAGAGESRWTLHVGAGVTDTEAVFGPPILGRQLDGEETAVGLAVGFDVSPHLGVRAGYRDLGEYEATSAPCPPGAICPTIIVPLEPATGEVSVLSLALVPRLPLGDRFSVFGTVGAADWNVEITQDADGARIVDSSATDLLLGLGAAWELRSGVGFEVEASTFDLEARTVGAGLYWRF